MAASPSPHPFTARRRRLAFSLSSRRSPPVCPLRRRRQEDPRTDERWNARLALRHPRRGALLLSCPAPSPSAAVPSSSGAGLSVPPPPALRPSLRQGQGGNRPSLVTNLAARG
uniref:Uncharacterized protein n=1 Tax=Oryza glaberrima TaxID=4538 RepID=I1PLW3_ORYGL